MDKSLTWYLAGPMSGIPQFNFPFFAEVAVALRAQDFIIVSPAELDSPSVQAAGSASTDGAMVDGQIGGETWGQILARDVRLVADIVGGIILLPDWEKSRGARLEAFVGLLTSKQFASYDPGVNKAFPAHADHVRLVLKWNMP